MVNTMPFLWFFAVFDPSPLAMCINCSFFLHYYLPKIIKIGWSASKLYCATSVSFFVTQCSISGRFTNVVGCVRYICDVRTLALRSTSSLLDFPLFSRGVPKSIKEFIPCPQNCHALYLKVRQVPNRPNTLYLKKGYHPTTNDNLNNSSPIPVIFLYKYCWVNIPSKGCLIYHLTCLLYVPYLGKL